MLVKKKAVAPGLSGSITGTVHASRELRLALKLSF